MQYLY